MSKNRHRQNRLQTFSGINMTPLMDLTFLLLIVFMITAPILEYSVDVSPPQMKAEDINEENSLLIGLSKTGQILYEGESIQHEKLRRKLEQIYDSAPQINILIRADQSRPYKEVVDIMRTVRKTNLRNIALVTREEE